MLFPLKLSFYITRKFFKDFFLCLLTFTSIIQVFTIIDVLRKKDLNSVTILPIIKLLLLKTPYIADSILPYMVVLSMIYTFHNLSKNNELVIIRSVGISVWQFIFPIILSFFVFSLIYVVVLNPFIASTYHGYNKYKSILGGADESVIELSINGIWLKDKSDANLDSYIHASKIHHQGKYLTNVSIYLNDKQNNSTTIIQAPQANIEDGRIILENATLYKSDKNPEKISSYVLKSNFKHTESLEIIPLRSISIWDYNKTIEKLNKVGFSSIKYRYYFYKTIALPLLIVSLVIFSVPIGMVNLRKSQRNYRLAIGLGATLILYFISNLIGAMTELGSLPMQISVVIQPLVFSFIGLALIFHLEDG